MLLPDTLMHRMPMRSTMVIMLLVVLLVGCASQPPAAGSATPSENSAATQGSGSIGSTAAPVIGVTLDEELRVIDVEAGGAAEQAGIQRGDVLAKIGNTTLEAGTSSATLLELVQNLIASQQPAQLTLLRGGQEITIAVQPTAPAARPNQPTPTAVPVDQVYF